MTDRKHNVIATIDDQEVGFRFSTWTFAQTIKRAELKGVIEMYQKLGALDIDTVIILTMEARKEFLYSEKKEESVTMRDAAEMIDKLGGVIPAMELFSEGIQGHPIKNVATPTTAG